MREEPVALVPKAGGEAGGRGRRLVGPRRAPSGLFRPHEARFAAHEAPKATIAPFTTRSRRALRGIRPSGTARLYADRAFLIPASRRHPNFGLGGVGREGKSDAGFRRVLGSKPGLRFCRFGRGFAVISGYFWLFLAISGLGASPGGPGSKLIILRATGESQKTALIAFLYGIL